MGNEHSTQNKPQKANAEKKAQNGELNGHAVPAADETEPETSKKEAVEQKSETLPAPVTNEPKPSEKEEVDSSKANGTAHVDATPEQNTTVATEAEPPKKAPKPSGDEVSNFLGKMFKKKSEPVKPAAENNDSVDAPAKAVDLKINMQTDKVFINADQKEILEQVAEQIKLQLVDAIPAQPISSSSLTKNSSKTDEILPDLHATQEPVAVVEKSITEEPVKRKASEIHIRYPKSADAEPKAEEDDKALKEDKEPKQLVESIISDEKEQACESEPNGTKQELASISKNLTKVADEAVDTIEVLSRVEEPVIGAEEPSLVAEEIAEILQVTQEQESLDVEELKRNKFKKALLIAQGPVTTSVKPVLSAKEEAASGSVVVDEESWEILEEPVNISGSFEEPVLTRSKCNLADSSQLHSQLRSVCTKVFEDASYKVFSVDVYVDKSSVHVTIELCPDELTCLNKVSSNTVDRSTRKPQHGRPQRMRFNQDADVLVTPFLKMLVIN
ncbi:protein IWS1 homolog A-like isoform X1 [Carassius carassius]|uniref:protein IWS1 homolog A-like isoform X1 n=1 Tax=Carassius carassius TaxID=217509 RepID=UPI002868A0BF|nr:protein IWS1 homolog A-like isoform X1 [Carassius carassius]